MEGVGCGPEGGSAEGRRGSPWLVSRFPRSSSRTSLCLASSWAPSSPATCDPFPGRIWTGTDSPRTRRPSVGVSAGFVIRLSAACGMGDGSAPVSIPASVAGLSVVSAMGPDSGLNASLVLLSDITAGNCGRPTIHEHGVHLSTGSSCGLDSAPRPYGAVKVQGLKGKGRRKHRFVVAK